MSDWQRGFNTKFVFGRSRPDTLQIYVAFVCEGGLGQNVFGF